MMLNIILRKLPSHHREVSVMAQSSCMPYYADNLDKICHEISSQNP